MLYYNWLHLRRTRGQYRIAHTLNPNVQHSGLPPLCSTGNISDLELKERTKFTNNEGIMGLLREIYTTFNNMLTFLENITEPENNVGQLLLITEQVQQSQAKDKVLKQK